jgi:hypothetical protein
MTRTSLLAATTAIAILATPIVSLAQVGGGSAGGGTGGAGSGSSMGSTAGSAAGGTVGAPSPGSTGSSTTGIGGGPSGPGNPGGLSNPGPNPGVANQPTRGTNSAGTALSSGVTTGSASGGARTKEDEAIDAETKAVDRKLRGICRGC